MVYMFIYMFRLSLDSHYSIHIRVYVSVSLDSDYSIYVWVYVSAIHQIATVYA